MKLLFGLLATGLLLAGCTSASEPVEPSMDEEGRYVIHMTAANRFTPMNAKIPVNATVIWVNDGGVHDVTAHDKSWSSEYTTGGGLGKAMGKGDVYTRTFSTAGKVDYHCDRHSSTGMVGTLHVG